MGQNHSIALRKPLIRTAATCLGLLLCGQALASSASVWQPQISEKILVLPQNQLELSLIHI